MKSIKQYINEGYLSQMFGYISTMFGIDRFMYSIQNGSYFGRGLFNSSYGNGFFKNHSSSDDAEKKRLRKENERLRRQMRQRNKNNAQLTTTVNGANVDDMCKEFSSILINTPKYELMSWGFEKTIEADCLSKTPNKSDQALYDKYWDNAIKERGYTPDKMPYNDIQDVKELYKNLDKYSASLPTELVMFDIDWVKTHQSGVYKFKPSFWFSEGASSMRDSDMVFLVRKEPSNSGYPDVIEYTNLDCIYRNGKLTIPINDYDNLDKKEKENKVLQELVYPAILVLENRTKELEELKKKNQQLSIEEPDEDE